MKCLLICKISLISVPDLQMILKVSSISFWVAQKSDKGVQRLYHLFNFALRYGGNRVVVGFTYVLSFSFQDISVVSKLLRALISSMLNSTNSD